MFKYENLHRLHESVGNPDGKGANFADDSNAFVIHKNMPELKHLAQELICKL